jgi:hypothetical protein
MIGAYLIDTITLRMDKGSDEWQEPNAPEDVSVKAFIDYGEHRIQNEAGEVVVSMAKVYMRPRTIITSGFATRAANTISYKDKIVYDGQEHAIMKISKSRDFSVRSMDVYVT